MAHLGYSRYLALSRTCCVQKEAVADAIQMTCLSLCLFSLEISGYTKVIFTLFQCLFPNLIFLVCAAQGHPHSLSLHAIPTTRAGHGSRAGEILVSSSPYQLACLNAVGFRNARCSRRSVFLLRDQTEMTPRPG